MWMLFYKITEYANKLLIFTLYVLNAFLNILKAYFYHKLIQIVIYWNAYKLIDINKMYFCTRMSHLLREQLYYRERFGNRMLENINVKTMLPTNSRKYKQRCCDQWCRFSSNQQHTSKDQWHHVSVCHAYNFIYIYI